MPTLPNLLTVSRIACVPVLLTAFLLEKPWIALVIFITASLTDFFDGYTARTLQQVSSLGRSLDLIADKILVSTTLLMLAAKGMLSNISLIAAVIILAREFLISGLREHSAQAILLSPSVFAKAKTALQMIALGLLIVAMTQQGGVPQDIIVAWVAGEIALWLSALLAVVSAAGYVRSFTPQRGSPHRGSSQGALK